MNEQTLQIPLLAGFLGLMFGWLIFGFSSMASCSQSSPSLSRSWRLPGASS